MSKSRIVLPIEGMSCASCATTVQEALGKAGGVTSAAVNYATGKAAVDYDETQTNVAELIKTVRAAGYDSGQAETLAWQALETLRLQQASALAYFDCFWVFAMVMLALVPVVLLMKRSVAEKGARVGGE